MLPLTFSDEGNRRAVRFWSFALPAYVHYELTDWSTRGESEELRNNKFRSLHARYSPRAEALVNDMRGYFLKAAQLMSTRDDFTPLEYIKWCKKIQNEAPVCFSSLMARKFAEEELGIRFKEWIEEPIGSASIGQVYLAKLGAESSRLGVNNADNHTKEAISRWSDAWVAIKVQGENAERQFRADMKTLRRFCELALPQFVAPLKEIESQFMMEFDYKAEAENLTRMRKNLIKSPWSQRAVIPEPILATRRVLVMEYLQGKKITDFLEDALQKEVSRLGATPDQVREEWIERMSRQRDLNDTMYERLMRKLYYWCSRVWSVASKDSNIVDTFALLDTVMRVHGHQVLIDGEFNGDPHPGNILLLPDGRIGLIDFGQVKRINDETRKLIARLVLAVNNRDQEKTANLVRELGVKSRFNDKEVQYRMISFWIDRDTEEVTGGMNAHKFLQEMEAKDPAVEMNGDLVMVCRCSVMIRSLAAALGLKVGTTSYWRESAERALQAST